ncbi:hypothetical protein XELAEV_18004396mg [Xenopus laevis]|uniref:Uncharacterized protein n=1 Tax=Xenopus laevis TaxID=8355 RepID=A0A974GYP4_XENLA|nr:hypothetical protein XELAEV_18004396mg [Xenopus laevis]
MALSMLDVLRVCTVLEDSLDQLSVLGYIMPVSYHGRSDIVGNEIGKILKTQRQLEGQFAADVIAEMLTELESSGSFHSLQQAVANEKERKANFYNVITR